MTGSQYAMSSESSVKVEGQYFPYGEDRTLFSGTDVIHYYPAPGRDEQGRPVIEGDAVTESRAQELSVSTRTETVSNKLY